jgi:hypothetical protein
MGDIFEDCYECSRECIQNQFCEAEGNVSLPKKLKIKIIANPEFWGFDDGEGNILSEGEAIFSNGHYDFFDGYDELHFATKQCGSLAPVQGPFRDEQRPDVLYRSVYDPDDPTTHEFGGVKHYGSDGSRDDIERGGAEVYLIDRAGTATSDLESCDTSDPTSIYKKFPENFGFGTKISTTDTVFKNKTGAWRYISLDNCYDNLFTDSSLVSECDGTPKQHIIRDENFGAEYDPFQIRVSGEFGCVRDGEIPAPYRGSISLIHRASGVEDFINVVLQYNTASASGINTGNTLGFSGEYLNGTYTVFEVNHSGDSTYCKLVSTLGSGYIQETGEAYWAALGTFDPNTCCGGVAHNISNETKRFNNVKNYHADFGRIFNNNKNKLQSNRFPENRYTYGLGATAQINGPNSFRKNTKLPSFDESGVVFNSGFPEFLQEYPYYGAFYDIDKYDTSVRSDGKYNKTQGNNGTCYSKKASVSIYPDCITQYAPYDECETMTRKYLMNQISRLAVVYRGCNFEDTCTYNPSGHPYIVPTGINDLRKGLAGQEIYMYVNLSTVWGPQIKMDPCGCGEDPPPGNEPPIFVEVPSPVTFPSFPKFDLNPEEYGCNDPIWQLKYSMECESGSYPINCGAPSSLYACDIRQPYTTYGFIRNLCGNEFKDKRQILTDSFNELIQQGNYRNTSPSGLDGPMYWEFNNPLILESGRTGGFSSSGNYPFWGTSDSEGRLVGPLFRAKPAIAYTRCGDPPTEIPYLDFDLCSTRASGWPTESTPFLIEIDHDDTCVGCASSAMDSEVLNLSLFGLGTEFSHAPSQSNKYGFNSCRYVGEAIDPTYSCASGYVPPCNRASDEDFMEPYIGNTCGCLNQDITLYASKFEGTDKIIGWTSQGVKNSFIKLSGCDQPSNITFLSTLPYQETHGFSIYGSFKLACEDQISYLEYPKVGSGGGNIYWFGHLQDNTPIGRYFATSSCSLKYPSSNSDLKLQALFVLVGSGYENLFNLIPDSYLMPGAFYGLDLEDNSTTPIHIADMLFEDGAFGCPTYMTEYGCLVNSYGSGQFVPCVGCGPEVLTCDCEGIECTDCGKVISYNGSPTVMVPKEYITPCGCNCNAQPMRVWKRENGVTTLVESFEASPSCSGAVVYVTYSGEYGVSEPVYLHEINSFDIRDWAKSPIKAISSSACSWHTGPNALAENIKYELTIPEKLHQGSKYCSTLTPAMCEAGECEDSNVNLGSCKDPIPGSGFTYGVSVNKRSCYPEIMVVNKIECLESGFKLYVDREYHSHDRTWQKLQAVSQPAGPPVLTCLDIQKGAYRYSSSCVSIPFATPSDGVTPAFHTDEIYNEDDELIGYRGVCSTHPSSGVFANQDFIFGPNPIATGEDILWNYFNLFYKDGFPSSKYHPAIYLGDPNDPPIPEDPCLDGTVISDTTILNTGDYLYPTNRYGIDATNKKHSCLQDYTECGGDLFCNKLFFPRKSYKVGTKITKFGALQLCRSNNERYMADWYAGYQDFTNDDGSFNTPDIYLETQNGRFIDACNPDIWSHLQEDISLDETELIVDDYLPLLGINSNNFRYTIDSKSCIIVNTGCLSSWIPTHSKVSIDAGVHAPKTFLQDGKSSFGYYLDKTSTLASDNCLFNPFKIMADVECCSSNIRTKASGDPTSLEYILEGVPSWACGGFTKDPLGCPYCSNSICSSPKEYFYDAPQPVCLSVVLGTAQITSQTDMPYYDDNCGLTCPPTGAFSMRPGVVDNGYNNSDLDVIGIARGEALSPTPEVAMGSGDPIGLIGCYCYNGDTLYHWANEIIGDVTSCEGLHIVSTTNIITGGYECGDYLYVPSIGSTGDTPSLYNTCCVPKSLCDTLLSCWKIPKGDACYTFRKSELGDYSADFENCTQCRATWYYKSCEDSVLKAVITEG